MADGGMTWEDTHAKRIERFRGMDVEEWAKRNAGAMRDLEIIWMLASERLCNEAGDDRFGALALLSADANDIMHQLKSLHRRMDKVAAQGMSLPMPRDGSR